MSTEPLPALLDVRKAAAREATVAGTLTRQRLTRLEDILAPGEVHVEGKLDFLRDEENRFVADVEVAARLAVYCQRCLEPMDIEVASKHRLAIIGDDEAAGRLPGHLEPWLVPEEQADPGAVVEDELILAMPIVSYHESGDCLAILKEFQEAGGSPAERTDNPFNVLEQLKSGGKDTGAD